MRKMETGRSFIVEGSRRGAGWRGLFFTRSMSVRVLTHHHLGVPWWLLPARLKIQTCLYSYAASFYHWVLPLYLLEPIIWEEFGFVPSLMGKALTAGQKKVCLLSPCAIWQFLCRFCPFWVLNWLPLQLRHYVFRICWMFFVSATHICSCFSSPYV